MFTARITRQRGEKVVKDEVSRDTLSGLLAVLLAAVGVSEILEIHIVREKLWNG